MSDNKRIPFFKSIDCRWEERNKASKEMKPESGISNVFQRLGKPNISTTTESYPFDSIHVVTHDNRHDMLTPQNLLIDDCDLIIDNRTSDIHGNYLVS